MRLQTSFVFDDEDRKALARQLGAVSRKADRKTIERWIKDLIELSLVDAVENYRRERSERREKGCKHPVTEPCVR